MTVATQFHNYQSSRPNANVVNAALNNQECPNLRAIQDFLLYVYGGQSLGFKPNPRSVRGGTALSTHAYGAALDWRYMPADSNNPDARYRWNVNSYTAARDIMDWLISFSAELGIQAIHDYWGDRIWRANRSGDANGGWKKQYGAGGGMGERWASYIHIEVHPNAYFDGRSVVERTGIGQPDPEPEPDPDPIPDPPPVDPYAEMRAYADARLAENPPGMPNHTLVKGMERNGEVFLLQRVLNEFAKNGRIQGCGNPDGLFGNQTEVSLRGLQSVYLQPDVGNPDGEYGPRTHLALQKLSNALHAM